MKGALLYEGKAKQVFKANGEAGKLVLSYKNDATAFNGEKKSVFPGKGRLNNEIASHIFSILQGKGVETHFIERLNETEQLVQQTEIIPLEVVVRNVAAGSITKRLGIEERMCFESPIVELFYKDDALGDPFINDEHALFLTNVTRTDLKEIKTKALEINRHLQTIFQAIRILLVDFKLEFGRLACGSIVLADEISPDTCRLWDVETFEKLDKDVFRHGTGDLLTVYQEILNRLEEQK
ncbi:phosphoribosylaminoimidazole-succinocarboxamide synthase [Virgibacillus pantothenticus]|uniref:Phosphoribosylaminoimidazole-succinocarboxamide synthase n=1 Tax=Virgibacillus pantothenticus TaxID=1473 RepID=A0A0L0QKP6_VIRPA|nr:MULTISPECIES: phosphoribosylaminoimidazolesuccinocarboxamide synthase [Virgibacillus]API91440.1 phosphoribosylaminoimidazolesuccinocarboxamide synthase [Virgibacillus sp. 6R]KNE19200.1 phosphoribosylaminoimidazole-succinocarboxamide synthase [Virgibacillus pantothenticus]MBS7426692.1 phosphoribosylaminoimidazolesuccinocarboxamide synthase [Virgibacillus sp. 19R1-5]MBU8568416.1 phosphoribosylaminoimidazolesuccinocarboxamide synthase [Virgibacillus pantothenticus]MBU8602400.1 phosphoribosylam